MEKAVSSSASRMYLVSPLLDFWLLGGASLALLPFALVLFPADGSTSPDTMRTALMIAVVLDYLVSFPHFAYSYQLMYRRFGDKVAGRIDAPLRANYVFAGIVVPVALGAFFIFGYTLGSTRVLQYAVSLRLLTFGWHYAKQGFGILTLLSRYKGVFYSPFERKLLLFNTHLLWIYAWVMFNTTDVVNDYFGIPYAAFDLPKSLETGLAGVVGVSTLCVMAMFARKWRASGDLPPFNGLTAYVAAAYIWVVFRFGLGESANVAIAYLFVPFLHSLQYSAVVLRMKRNQVERGVLSRGGFAKFALLGLVIGAVGFVGLPAFLNAIVSYDRSVFGRNFFAFLFWSFINVHHFFVDSVIWRRESSEPSAHLYRP